MDACSSRLFPSLTVMGSWLLKITREEGGQTHGEEIDNQDTRTRTWLWRLGRYIRALYHHHVLIKWAGHYSSGEYCQEKSRNINRKGRNINSYLSFIFFIYENLLYLSFAVQGRRQMPCQSGGLCLARS